jgi:hypothetical protein
VYRISLTLTNAMTGDSSVITFQFDPTTLTQAKWNAAFGAVQAQLTTLHDLSTPKEPATW